MRERPILFSSPMVRAILDGEKTQTRRIVRALKSAPLPDFEANWRWGGDALGGALVCDWNGGVYSCPTGPSPYGLVGDRLWVKETIVRRRSPGEHGPHAYYVADDARVMALGGKSNEPCTWKWQRDVLPCIHLPRTCSRITLEVTGVRVERLQEITEDDALAEGMLTSSTCSARGQFEDLWNEINGKRASWESNPWVWVVEFKRVTPPAPSSLGGGCGIGRG